MFRIKSALCKFLIGKEQAAMVLNQKSETLVNIWSKMGTNGKHLATLGTTKTFICIEKH